jgi:hypothetical protein
MNSQGFVCAIKPSAFLSSSRMTGLNRMGYDSKTERDGASRGREIFQQKNTRDPSLNFQTVKSGRDPTARPEADEPRCGQKIF